MFKNVFSCVIIIITILLCPLQLFASDVIYNNAKNNFYGPAMLSNNKLIITGDSYSGFFYKYLSNKAFYLMVHAVAGKTIVDNKQIMIDAMCDDFSPFVMICIGVNDHCKSTPLDVFEDTLANILDKSVENNKIVFINSYCDYPMSTLFPEHKTSDYDNVIRKLGNKYKNLIYIDMKDCFDDKFFLDDGIHYNALFYDVLYERLLKLMM